MTTSTNDDNSGERLVAFAIDWALISFVTGGIKSLAIPDFPIPWATWGGLGLIGLVVSTLYFGFLEGPKRQATIGKEVMKLKVVDLAGRPLTYSRSFVRALTKLVPLGWLLALGDEQRALHDYVAGTKVVER